MGLRGRGRRDRRRIGAVVALALTGVAVVASACTGGSQGGSASAGRAGAKDAAPAVAAGRPAVAVPSPGASASAAGPASAGGGTAHSASSGGDLALGGAKIRTVQMDVVVRRGVSLVKQADAAETIALGAGGEVDTDDRQTGGSFPSATLLLRVPPEQLPAVLDELSKLGIERSRQLSTQDVTGKVADVDSRVASAKQEIARLRALYLHATKVADVITVESELSDRESNLEALEAQQRALSAQTATAAITLNLTMQAAPVKHAHKPKPVTHHRTGFLGGLENGWHAFVRVASAVATAAGAVLPFAVLLIALAVALRLLWPRLRPRRPAPPTAAP